MVSRVDLMRGRLPPSPEEIRLTLGDSYALWERLRQFVESRYQVVGTWSRWGPVEVGWGLRYRREGKALVALYPQEGRIIAQVVLGRAQAEQAMSLALGQKVSKLLRETPQLADGRWLSIPVLDEADARDVEQLLRVKLPPARQAG